MIQVMDERQNIGLVSIRAGYRILLVFLISKGIIIYFIQKKISIKSCSYFNTQYFKRKQNQNC